MLRHDSTMLVCSCLLDCMHPGQHEQARISPDIQKKTKKGNAQKERERRRQCLQLVKVRLTVIPFLGELLHQALQVAVPGAACIWQLGPCQAALYQCLQDSISNSKCYMPKDRMKKPQ